MAEDLFPIKKLLKFQVFLLTLIFLILTGETTLSRQVELDKRAHGRGPGVHLQQTVVPEA